MKVFRNLAIFVMATGLSASLFAQGSATGNIYGTVSDEQGGKLPGVGVTLSGCGAPHVTTSGSQGEFRFTGLAPCAYSIKTELNGFATVERTNVEVNVGTNTELSIPMKIASVATTITVTSETPLLDTRKQTEGSNFGQAQLKSIPTARDPWAVLQQVPSVLLDRQNVGGSLSGQQSTYVAKGADATQNAWNVDGVAVTDMAATGSSSTYYDFDAFQEMQVTTGGSDASISVPGASINMVTKRGTNDVHGSARVFETSGLTEAHNVTDESKEQAVHYHNPALATTDRVNGVQDYGVEAGGPIWPDKAWLWGSYGRDQIDITKTTGVIDRTTLENYAGKLNIQPVESNSATLFYFDAQKIKLGRNAGPSRPQPTTWNQDGPTTIWKGEDSQVFGPNFVADVSYSYTHNKFGLVPQGTAGYNGIGCDVVNDPKCLGSSIIYDANAVFQNSFEQYTTDRPQHSINLTTSAFFSTGSLSHELKFGFDYRKLRVTSSTQWPGNQAISYVPYGSAGLKRAGDINNLMQYTDFHVTDTLTMNNLTVNLGVRYDDQKGHNGATSVGPNTLFSDVLPAVSSPGGPTEAHWKNWEPRIGVTYALGAQKTTLLRASYSRFADQMGSGIVNFDNPTNAGYLYYYWYDHNGNNIAEPGELAATPYAAVNVDPNNPTAAINTIDHNLKAPTTDEFTVGVDHQLLPEFVVGGTYTYRKRKDLTWTPYIGLTNADFELVDPGTPVYTGRGVAVGTTAPLYGVIGGYTGNYGRILENRPNFDTTYSGFEVQATKRLSNKWMAHASFTYNDWKQHGGASSCQDPTNQVGANGYTCASGVQVYQNAGTGSGSFGNVYINSKWQFNVSGLYQLPMNFNFSANFYGRQGYPEVLYNREDPGDGLGTRLVPLTGDSDRNRLKNLYQLDLRIEKVIPLFQKADLTLSGDCFNATNNATILQRYGRVTSSPAGSGSSGRYPTIKETQSARILRFGARLSF